MTDQSGRSPSPEGRYTEVEVSGPEGTVEADACWDCGAVVWHRPTHDHWHEAISELVAPARTPSSEDSR